MKRSKRLSTLCKELLPCTVFADVGCDHGYMAQYMLENSLCDRAYISDISEPSLEKARRLLSGYIQAGKVQSFCCAGLEQVPKDAEQVLIAGMGGEEIVGILKNGFFPSRFVLQPMKNTEKVRRFLMGNGYSVLRDYTFSDEKFYDVLCAERGKKAREYDVLSLRFGYDNIHFPGADFLLYLRTEQKKCDDRLAAAGRDIPAVSEKRKELTEALHEAERNLR